MGYRFGDYRFEPESGELFRTDNGEPAGRLSPQPAELLALLLAAAPEVVSRERIRDALWPDVQVEFEQGLHFAIRQIRSALGDSAAKPRYVENLPRRGYRIVCDVESYRSPKAMGKALRRGALLLLAGIALPVVILLVISARRGDDPTLRVAIMPFEPVGVTGEANAIAESLLERVHRTRPEIDWIGPTTTEAYDGEAQRLRALVDEFDIDYVVNGRRLGADYEDRYIAEIIRAADGAHVWVEYLDAFPSAAVVDQLERGVRDSLP